MSKKNKKNKSPAELIAEQKKADMGAIQGAKDHFENVVQPQKEKEAEEEESSFDDVIATEDALLNSFSPKRFKIELTYLGKEYHFEVLPIGEATAKMLSLFDIDKQIYSDMSDEAKDVMFKMAAREQLSSEDLKLIAAEEKKSGDEANQKNYEKITEILANFVSPPLYEKGIFDPKNKVLVPLDEYTTEDVEECLSDGTFIDLALISDEARLELKRDFWKNMPFMFRTVLAGEVRERLGFSQNNMINLFQAG